MYELDLQTFWSLAGHFQNRLCCWVFCHHNIDIISKVRRITREAAFFFSLMRLVAIEIDDARYDN